jgi:hypothetical protein
MSMNAALSRSGRIGGIQGHPKGELRGPTKLVNMSEDVWNYAAEKGIAESEALEKELTGKSAEF